MPSVTVVGAGWAGLSAAIHLTQSGHEVTLLEAARQPGGRARMVMFDDLPVDNGQHILLGAYSNILELLSIIGLDESFVLSRKPLSLHVKGAETHVSLNAPALPAPLHLLIAFIRAQGLGTGDKVATMLNWLRLINADSRQDMTVTELLHCTGQPERVCHYLWNPLCIAALNTAPEIASARLFQNVLRDSFMRRRADSDMLLPRYDMGRLFPQPASDWLKQKGVNIRFQERVNQLTIQDGAITGIKTSHQEMATDCVVLATNPWQTAELLQDDAVADICQHLQQIEYEPISTVYLRFPRSLRLQPAMLGLADSTTQWLFDRRITSHPKILAAVISAAGEHASMDKAALIEQVMQDVRQYTDINMEPEASLVIREKRATFSATPATERLRPDNMTPIKGLYLAGDYTQTGYPATLEGAVISGKLASQLICRA